MKLKDLIRDACHKHGYCYAIAEDGHVMLRGTPEHLRSTRMKEALKVLGEVLEEMSD